MSVKVYSKLIGVPRNCIPSSPGNVPAPGHDHGCGPDHGHHPSKPDHGHHHKPPYYDDEKSQKIVVVQNDLDRLKLSGKELNTGDFVRVRNTGKIFIFDDHGRGDAYGFWEEYKGPVDKYGDPVTNDTPGGLSKYVVTALFSNSDTVTLNHNLATEDIVVNVFDSTKKKILVDVEIVNDNTIKLSTAGPLNETVKVVVIG